jgi:RimJ/RimL family protein N-acetyltransferase
MQQVSNVLGQPVGLPLSNWSPPGFPSREPMDGRFCRLEPFNPSLHAAALYQANRIDIEGRMWTYLPYGPFDTLDSYRAWAEDVCSRSDPLFFAILERMTGKPLGVASYLRIDPPNGSIEVGHLSYSPLLQRASAATEAMFLMMERAFSLGYRRYEWKCDALNGPSRSAAQRLGFSFEGVFRQAAVVKGRNRDTAWFAIIDRDWPSLRDAFERWLHPSNFDENGRQRARLSTMTVSNPPTSAS